jgi:subtilisin family serine protease
MILILLNFLLSSFFHGQQAYVPLNRWLIELKSDNHECFEQWWSDNGFDHRNYLKKSLPVENWMVIEIPGDNRTSIARLPCVKRVLVDRPITWRNTIPNDPVYINQSDMNLIGMPKAWDITTGGLTARGDTIVVAVVDNGFDISHPDLAPNIWVNKAEIPNDQIDNDGNGYVDDYHGLNIATGHDDHPIEWHGTQVCGLIGAKGNNAIGVTGINWNIKIMLLSRAEFESEVIEGYQYVLDMRKKYNQSNGLEGAFVVVTNLSGGIDNAFAADHPMWCEMYDKLGAAGILSVTAAPNNPISVDVDGDMPTTCTSLFMISVTNVDATDVLVSTAGFGNVSIDLGAPGEGTLTVYPNNQYKAFKGTSAAAPHVSGTIALMYSTPCTTFLDNVNSDPDGVALNVKDIILSTATNNNSLQEITVTGKRIQTDAALRQTVAACGVESNPAVLIKYILPNPVRSDVAKIYFEVRGDTSTAYIDVYTTAGARVKSFPINQEEFQQGYVELDTKPLAAALYFVTIRSKKYKSTNKLFVY